MYVCTDGCVLVRACVCVRVCVCVVPKDHIGKIRVFL